MLGKKPEEIDEDSLELLLPGVSIEVYRRFLDEYEEKKGEYRLLEETAGKIRDKLRYPQKIEWTGHKKTAGGTSLSRDLRCVDVNWSIGVKFKSDVVLNSSPENLFVHIPQGESKRPRSQENWYLKMAQKEYTALCDWVIREGNVEEESEREKLLLSQYKHGTYADTVQTLTERKEFKDLYVAMCRAVARESARLFNERAEKRNRNSNELILRNFLRINGERYISLGIEKDRRAFALVVPSADDVVQAWSIETIKAWADERAEQSKVIFEMTVIERGSGRKQELRYHAEIRWSHGKFTSKPEAKLYKEFKWSEVCLFESLI